MGFAEGGLEGEKVFEGKIFPRTYLPPDETKAGASDLAKLVTGERKALWEALEQHGALLFRGFRVDAAEDLTGVVEAFGWEEMPYSYGRTMKAHRVFTASEDPVDKFINFHHEMSLVNESCSKMFFYCQQPSPENGQTAILRSDVLAKRMEEELPEVVAMLEEEGIRKVVRTAAGGEGDRKQGWQQMFKTEDEKDARQRAVEELGCDTVKLNEDGTAEFVYGPMNPMRVYGGRKVWWHSLHGHQGEERSMTVELGEGGPLPPAVVDIYSSVLEENGVDVKWRKGDVLVVDNLHAQHARRPGKDPRVVLVSLCK
ncbi:hypothetical protein Taro_018242 [Colocasia esculenta]|uniref:TauD/TfdA-like domain-containing protein n=1 Tax=Colocasia esculenta TaxID=4460 RepID=A0A843UTB2_COLES|nr:hypothetical protein [Colocasia esculenta]